MSRPALALALTLALCGTAAAADPPKLSPELLAAGWVQLFDGATDFGWEKGEGVTVADGKLKLDGTKEAATATFATPLPIPCEVDLAADGPLAVIVTAGTSESVYPIREGHAGLRVSFERPDGKFRVVLTQPDGTPRVPALPNDTLNGPFRLGLRAAKGCAVTITSARFRPITPEPLFNGKDLAGWEPYTGDAKRNLSKFTVTPQQELRIQNGPGDLRTLKSYADFCLQLECKTQGVNLNSGVFFRCQKGEYQNGYEAQIHNGFQKDDATKPTDFGTGAIYRRVPARRVVSRDNEWFYLTLLASGDRVATWVDGVPVVSWKDDRKPDDNPRKGLRTKAGHLSLQGHDPTTDILFRNLRVLGAGE